jgi:hypothetical protein
VVAATIASPDGGAACAHNLRFSVSVLLAHRLVRRPACAAKSAVGQRRDLATGGLCGYPLQRYNRVRKCSARWCGCALPAHAVRANCCSVVRICPPICAAVWWLDCACKAVRLAHGLMSCHERPANERSAMSGCHFATVRTFPRVLSLLGCPRAPSVNPLETTREHARPIGAHRFEKHSRSHSSRKRQPLSHTRRTAYGVGYDH